MKTLALSLAAGVAAVCAWSAPAAAQGSTISEIIVYGNDPCPRSTDDDVVVCARRPESERYRIPERLRTSPRQLGQSWANQARTLETVGRTGINSCSPVGPGGFTGCLTQVIDQARQESRDAVRQDTAPEE